jgi:hypothetical protein
MTDTAAQSTDSTAVAGTTTAAATTTPATETAAIDTTAAADLSFFAKVKAEIEAIVEWPAHEWELLKAAVEKHL